MTDGARASVWDAVWLPWGNSYSITGTAAFNARLPGQWFQIEAGLHYNWHRSYDPTIGRYTQPDPLGFVDGPSVFGYAKGSPIIGIDFTGLVEGGPRIIGPDGKQIYPPSPPEPTKPQVVQPELEKPEPQLPTVERACNAALLRCLAKCVVSPICVKYPLAMTACGSACGVAYSFCRFAGKFKG